MNKEMMEAAGFGKEVKMIEQGICPICGLTVEQTKFKDKLSRDEFQISGMCQNCQDETFR